MHSAPLVVTETTFTRASDRDEQRGLVGYVAMVLNDALRLDGVTLRRSSAGELYLAYPARTDRSGTKHALLRPLDDGARRALQDQVFMALGVGGDPA